jgi:hypothetical protein
VNLVRSVDISITTGAEDAGEATKLEYSASDIEKYTVEKVAVVAKGEAAKDFKICTYTGRQKYLRCDKCGKSISLIPAFLGPPGAQEGCDEEGEEICSQITY